MLTKDVLLVALAGAFLLAGCNGGGTESGSTTSGPAVKNEATSGDKTIAFVTNGVSDFWTIAHKGCDKAQSELKGFKIAFVEPSETSAAGQKAKLDDLVANGVAGIAVSPVDPKNEIADLNRYASKCPLITQDGDAPDSNRLCYIGTDNVEAGKMAGETIKKALPNGGKIRVFVGKSDAQNAKERFQGIQQALAGSNVTIIDLRTDDGDHVRAKQNVADTLVKYPDIACCVGLWSYNGPAIVNAVEEAHMQGKVKIVCFDEEDGTLAGIRDGSVFGTVVQNPYEFGHQGMLLLAKIVGGDKSQIPADKRIIIPVRLIDKSNVADFAAKLKELRK